MTSHYTRGSVTTLQDGWCVGMASRFLFGVRHRLSSSLCWVATRFLSDERNLGSSLVCCMASRFLSAQRNLGSSLECVLGCPLGSSRPRGSEVPLWRGPNL